MHQRLAHQGMTRYHPGRQKPKRGKAMRGHYIARRPQPQTWDEFVEQVREAWEREQRRKPRGARTPENLKPGRAAETLWQNPKYAERRCRHVNSQSGKRCRQWAMRGATRCREHGGIRENPAHPAAVKAYARGDIDRETAHKAHKAQVKAAPQEEQDNARSALRDRGLAPHSADMLQGIEAQRQDDNGKAWRRWLKTLDNRASQAQVKRGRGCQEPE